MPGTIKEIPTSLTQVGIEKRITKFWSDLNLARRVTDRVKAGKRLYWSERPLAAAGSLDLSAARNRILKDLYVRMYRMQGLRVRNVLTINSVGIPLEYEMEQELGLHNRPDIERFGISAFLAACHAKGRANIQGKLAELDQLGVWTNLEEAHWTDSRTQIDNAWAIFAKLVKDGHIDSERTLVPWCPRCSTAISSSEVVYRQSQLESFYLAIESEDGKVEYLIWTTMPTQFVGNLALAVNPSETYVRLRATKDGVDRVFVVMKKSLSRILSRGQFDKHAVVQEFQGATLIGKAYRYPLADRIPHIGRFKGEWVHKIIGTPRVTSKGTGILAISPGFDPNDYAIGKEYRLPPFYPINESGVFEDAKTVDSSYSDLPYDAFVETLIKDLGERGRILTSSTIPHTYAHHSLCGSRIVNRPSRQWFFRTAALKKRALEELNRIKWNPSYVGESSLFEMIRRTDDICISRNRYLGTPIPAWRCICKEQKILSNTRELLALGWAGDVEITGEMLNDLQVICPNCGKRMSRSRHVLDIGFELGVVPWSQLNFPTIADDYKDWWPAPMVTENLDQLRTWIYYQIHLSLCIDGRIPFEAGNFHGDLRVDPKALVDGQDVLDLQAAREKFGADGLRWYLISTAQPWEHMLMDEKRLRRSARFVDRLFGIARYLSAYMLMDSVHAWTAAPDPANLGEEGKWLMSRLHSTLAEVERRMGQFRLDQAAHALQEYVEEDLGSDFLGYLKTLPIHERKRRDAGLQLLHYVFLKATTALAAFVPHVAEEIYQRLDGERLSIHLLTWPQAETRWIDPVVADQIQTVRQVVRKIRMARQEMKRHNRWPVRKAVVKANTEAVEFAIKRFSEYLKYRTNCFELEVVPVGEEWGDIELTISPNRQAIGRVYREWASKIDMILQNRPARTVKAAIEQGEYHLGVEGQTLKIEPNMVTFTTKVPENIIRGIIPGGEVYVYKDESDEIENIGLAREVIRRIQTMRKEMELDMDDFVNTYITCSSELQDILLISLDDIKERTHTRHLAYPAEYQGDYAIEWDIAEETVIIGITPLYMKEVLKAFGRIPSITRPRAEAIYNAGYTNIDLLSEASIEDLMQIGSITKAHARKVVRYFESAEEVAGEREMCSLCGAMVDAQATRCNRCGTEFGDTGEEGKETDDPDGIPADPGMVITECQVCHAPAKPNATNCSRCGVVLQAPPEADESDEVIRGGKMGLGGIPSATRGGGAPSGIPSALSGGDASSPTRPGATAATDQAPATAPSDHAAVTSSPAPDRSHHDRPSEPGPPADLPPGPSAKDKAALVETMMPGQPGSTPPPAVTPTPAAEPISDSPPPTPDRGTPPAPPARSAPPSSGLPPPPPPPPPPPGALPPKTAAPAPATGGPRLCPSCKAPAPENLPNCIICQQPLPK